MKTFALDPDLWDRLERWLKAQDLPPTRTAVLELALREFLDKRGAKR